MKRLFDLILSTTAMLIMLLPFIIIWIAVRLTSKGPAIYWSNRIGKDNKLFMMPKFRSMKIDTPVVASHLLINPDNYFTSIGSFLRKSSLDELPQLWSIIKGDMSLVGPRPALDSQLELIILRKEAGVDKLLPGLTGWAQINGRDDLAITQKVALDKDYMNRRSLWFDIKILCKTLMKVINGDGVLY